MSLPLADWQFWVVTLLAAASMWPLLRPFLSRGKAAPGPCSQCRQSGSAGCPRGAASDRLVPLRGGR